MAINLWRRFESLIKPAAEEVVTITAIHADGTVTATTMTNGVVRLRCAIELVVGDKAFAADGAIIGKAPSLTYYELEV
ncbi:MAG: hypothetical protein L6271_10215 [Desulfobacteraceae bacterium]|nr:hypothetical protein [Desulfobacteraceae bacterium]